jgi:5,10-methylenetetrahydrofolate reductase
MEGSGGDERINRFSILAWVPTLLESLTTAQSVVAAELRPPRAELETAASMNAWIDTYHAVRGLTRSGTYVFLTDSAVGSKEEDNLRHLAINLGSDAPRSAVVPFLTCKHPLEYCLAYADRAHQQGFDALVVLGGDRNVGPPRCVEHAWQLRAQIRERVPALTLGGWANPHGDCASQVGHLLDADANAEFYLTQIVSHHSRPGVERFLSEASRRGLEVPGVFGLFFYRSANTRTLSTLSSYLPVPVEELKREFAAGATPEDVCARSLRELASAGVRHFYISNLPLGRAAATLRRILSLASATA